MSITGTTASPLSRTAGVYGYTASTAVSTFFGAGTSGDHWLSTNNRVETVTFNNFTGGVRGAGAFFFGSDISGSFVAGASIFITATDADGTISQTLTNTATSTFFGVVSSGSLLSLTLSAGDVTGIWPTANDLTLGTAAAVGTPEPGTFGAAAMGLVALAWAKRKRG